MSRPAPTRGVPMRRPNPIPRKGAPGSSRPGGSNSTHDSGYLYVAGVRDPSKRVTEYSTEADVCPVCHTDRQFNKSLKLQVSPCYHKMCTNCIDRLFTLGPEPCPQCGKILRKVNFGNQTFEDLKVEKEVSVRRRIAELYNKTEKDFTSSREYDDYLEQVEDITFNLLNDVDVDATEARIAEYKRQNEATITANKERAALDTLKESEREEMEKQAKAERRQMIEENDRIEAEEEARIKAEVVDALARGAKQTARDIERRGAEHKAARAQALAQAIPPSLARLLTRDNPKSEGDEGDEQHSPGSPSYEGPFVPYAYSDPDKAPWVKWIDPLDDYADTRSGVLDVKRNRDGRYRGGAFDLKQFWTMELRAAVEGLGIEPMA